ncbi:WRKY transcription factor 22-like [Silene latifolia]|uniref:WRKY transcription factor 22-like n=1 Tax=Silene latifolia TaxID=37657 RepID=UPI003D78513D
MSELNFERLSDYSWDLQAIVKGHIGMLPSYSSRLQVEDYNTMSTTMNDECSNDDAKRGTIAVTYVNNASMPPRRRRSKYKNTLVHQATEDRILSDKWNWRKYGEKIIKGSPFPRSYYRCSNSSGRCMARKQVEQSQSEEGKFVISYINDHNHDYPSRRPSQAGRSSKRFRTSNEVLTTTETLDMATMSLPQIANEKVVGAQWNKDDDRKAGFVGGEGVYEQNRVFEDDFFAGLEYLESIDMDFISCAEYS